MEIPRRKPGLPGNRLPPKPRSDFIEEAIREAVERGDFDDLPGKGKPLNLETGRDEAFLARKILKDAGYVPPWLELEKEISRDRTIALTTLQRFRERYAKAQSNIAQSPRQAREFTKLLDRERLKAREQYHKSISAIAQKVFRFNLIVPIKDRQMKGINIDAAMAEFDSEFPECT